MPDQAQQIATYIAEHPVFVSHVPRPGYPAGVLYFPTAYPMPTAEQLAEEMIEDVGFQTLRLGGFLKTPDGQLISKGVALALPNADRAVCNLAVDALILAAEKQNDVSPLQAGVGAVVAALLLAAVLAERHGANNLA